MAETHKDKTADDKRQTVHKGKPVLLFDFEELFGDEVVVLIRLGSEIYELRKTKTGKLLLNK